MAALSAAYQHQWPNGFLGRKTLSLKMATSTTIYQGGGVCINTSGLAVPAADTTSFVTAGVALETKTTGASDSATYISVLVDGVCDFDFGAANATDATCVGKSVYWTYDGTVDLVATTSQDIKAGTCIGVLSASKVLVSFTNLG